MSCISINLGVQATGGASATTLPPQATMSVAAKPMTGIIGTSVKKTNPNVSASAQDAMQLDILLVCTVGRDHFLFVRPDEALWITVDKSIKYDVRSNTDWIVH